MNIFFFESMSDIVGEMRQNNLQLVNESGQLVRKYAEMVGLLGQLGEGIKEKGNCLFACLCSC